MIFFNLHVEHLERLTDRLRQFHKIFASGFHTKTRSIEKIALEPVQVQKLADHPDTKYHRVFLRDTERKELWSQLACLRVYPVEKKLPGEETWLIIRRYEGENETKHQFSNASEDTSIERLGKVSCSRYWIERALQDGKGVAKMADYQVRGWTGWHHHMVMTLLAMLFILWITGEDWE
jgi:SRSO17 transposase